MPATDCLALFNGTSQATPQAAATAALLIAEAGGHRALSPAQVLYSLESTADNINDPLQGHGRLNAYRALASLIRDTAAYSGPQPQAAGTAQLIAFAYNVSGTNKPTILDATFPAGVPVATDGTFRIADVPAATGTYKVAVWYDANGDGVIDAGDQIGVSSATCNSTSKCALGTITMGAVSSGYVLP
jgi:subtilisin family serine protease